MMSVTKMKIYIQAATAIILFAAYGQMVENSQLVNMSKQEFIRDLECVSTSKRQALCDRFNVCNFKEAPRVIKAYENCTLQIYPGITGRCNENEQLFPNMDIPSKIFDCIDKKIRRLHGRREKLEMMNFERCVRQLYLECISPIAYKGN